MVPAAKAARSGDRGFKVLIFPGSLSSVGGIYQW
jgi:hypothetical protein